LTDGNLINKTNTDLFLNGGKPSRQGSNNEELPLIYSFSHPQRALLRRQRTEEYEGPKEGCRVCVKSMYEELKEKMKRKGKHP